MLLLTHSAQVEGLGKGKKSIGCVFWVYLSCVVFQGITVSLMSTFFFFFFGFATQSLHEGVYIHDLVNDAA